MNVSKEQVSNDNDNANDNDSDTVPLDTKVDGTPFSVLLSQAVKLKTAQEAPLRSKYDALPSFYQNSIFPREQVIVARSLTMHMDMIPVDTDETDLDGDGYGNGNGNFDDGKEGTKTRMGEALRMKLEGNKAFQCGSFGDAMMHYEMAISVFRYLVNTNASWRNEGIKDAFIETVDYVNMNSMDRNGKGDGDGDGDESNDSGSGSGSLYIDQVREFLAVCYT